MSIEAEDSVQFEPFIPTETGQTIPTFMPTFIFGFQKNGAGACEKYYKGPIQSPFAHEQKFQLEALLAKFRSQTTFSSVEEPSLPLFSKRFPATRQSSRVSVLSPLCVENQATKLPHDGPRKSTMKREPTNTTNSLSSSKLVSRVGKRLPRRKRREREVPKSGQLLKKKKKKRSMHLVCNHCMKSFLAKPTYRQRFEHYLINHSCYGAKRIQYVIGRKHRSCTAGCSRKLGCIRFDITKGPVPS